MGRVKADGSGGFYWDENDSGPDQSGGTWSPGGGASEASPPPAVGGYTPPEGATLKAGESGLEADDWTMPTPPAGGGGLTLDPSPLPGGPTFTNTAPASTYRPGDPGTYQPGAPNDPRNSPFYLGGYNSGFDATKLGSSTDAKYTLGRALEQVAPTAANLQAVAQQLGYKYLGGDQIQLPDGTIVDAIKNMDAVGGPASWQFLVPGGGQTAGGGAAQAAGGAAGGAKVPAGNPNPITIGGGGLGGAAGAIQPTLDANAPVVQMMREALMRLMGQGAPTPDDPIIKGQVDAFRNSQQRGADQTRAALAERMAAEGLNSGGQGSGAFDTGVQGIQENVGNSTSGYQAALMGTELTARRQQLSQALSLAQAIGARDEATQLQAAISDLDRQLNYASLSQQHSQFGDQLGFNYASLEAELNRQAYLAAMNG